MATRMSDMGMDVQVNRRLNSKYDPYSEAEAIAWVNKLTGENVQAGREQVCATLKNGQILIKLVNAVYEGTPNLPADAAKIKKRPFKANTMTAPFKQMENIQMFLNACAAYGVPRASLFQTVDLYEARNMPQVLNTILQLGTESNACTLLKRLKAPKPNQSAIAKKDEIAEEGTGSVPESPPPSVRIDDELLALEIGNEDVDIEKCQRHGFNGETCGPKPTYENKREFTEEQLRLSEGIIGLQAGTNKLASQSGMSHGGQRHITDIKVDAASKESQSMIGLQMGSNKGASQSGMSHGGPRHIADIKVEAASKESQSEISLQMGTNKFATQAGMSHGGPRHIADIKVEAASKESAGSIGLQMGSNKGASQAGMSHGGQRHITDIKVDPASKDSAGSIGLQMGSNKGASQAGMSHGGQRHIADIKVGEASKDSQSIIGLQAGTNKLASQAGMSHGGQRHIADIKVGEATRDSAIGLQMGSNQGASQSGMGHGGQRHIADLKVGEIKK